MILGYSMLVKTPSWLIVETNSFGVAFLLYISRVGLHFHLGSICHVQYKRLADYLTKY